MLGKRGVARAGYDQEEAYFHQLDQKLIEKNRGTRKLELINGGKPDDGKPERSLLSDDPLKKRAA